MPLPDDFDPTIWGRPMPKLPPSTKPPRHRSGEKFLKGPIPWPWIERAAALPGQALAVGLVLWFEAGCLKTRTVKMTLARLQQLAMSEAAARRGLRALEIAGLVALESKPGRATEVTILEAPGTEAK